MEVIFYFYQAMMKFKTIFLFNQKHLEIINNDDNQMVGMLILYDEIFITELKINFNFIF